MIKRINNFKSGFVTIIGRPNVGKSTLLNKILKQKIVITSNKVQTTRKRTKGIYTNEKGQIIFIDTPGIHKPLNQLGDFLMEEVHFAIPDADLVILLTESTEEPGPGDQWIFNNFVTHNKPTLLVINKIDKIKKVDLDNIITAYRKLAPEVPLNILPVSAKSGENIDKLIDTILDILPDGPSYYDEDVVTEDSTRSITQEIIREKVLRLTGDEIPHSTAILIDHFLEEDPIIKIKATIYVERDSQKPIIIGKGGEKIKEIGIAARESIEKLVEKKVFLELFVKVKKNWRKDKKALKEFGYSL